MRRRAAVSLVALAALIGAAVAACDEDDPLTINYTAGFFAQANLPFVAVYVAQDRGFFEDENVIVNIEHAGPGGEHKAQLAAGQIDVTTLPAAEMLQVRAESGAPFVAVMLFGQRGDFGYAVLESSGIESPADFAGKIVGTKGIVQAEFLAMAAANGVREEDMEIVRTGFNPAVLAEGEVDVWPVFLSNEPDTLTRVMGQQIRVFEPADYGVPALGVAYIVTEDYLEDGDNRDALERFLRATVRAFEFALDDPAAAIESTEKFIPDDADLTHERFILDTELGNAVSDLTEENGVGWFTEQQFADLQDVLLEYDAMEAEVDLGAALDRSFLERIH